MPKIKLEHVVSCSSEDPDHIANNLLNSETRKKWKSKNVGETSVSVILQLEKSNKISGVDIGNENSSFVEVLVGRSSSQEQDYKIILAMSSFMTPMEARNLTNNNRVRMFTYDDLASSIRDEKWDRIKVVCTQPFNKLVQYGLSFITLHSPQEQKQEEPSTNIGKFTLRPESPNVLTAGSIFAKRKELTEDKITVAQAIKTSDKPKCKPVKIKTSSISKASSSSDKDEERNRNRRALFYDSDEEVADEKIDKVIEKAKVEEEKKKIETKTPKKTPRKKTENSPKPSSSKKDEKKENKTNIDTPGNSKRKIDITPKIAIKKRKLIAKPFEKLLEGVVFTISGIVNPERAILRTLALSMGAKYRPDWDNTCTHLICAFANTPKFNQVQGKGKIVTKSWVKDCHDQHKRLPWRRYALDRNDQGKLESEEEIEVVEEKDDLAVEEIAENNVISKSDYLSGSDTDDEIEKILAKQKKEQVTMKEKHKKDSVTLEEKQKKIEIGNTTNNTIIEENQKETQSTSKTAKEKEAHTINVTEEKQNKNNEIDEDDPFNVDTEEEELKKNPAKVEEEIPKIFQSEIFYIDNVFDEKEKHLLERLIKAFDGVVLTSLRSIVDFVITNEDSVEDVKERCSSVKCVSCTWIYECHDILKRIPCEKFRLDSS